MHGTMRLARDSERLQAAREKYATCQNFIPAIRACRSDTLWPC